MENRRIIGLDFIRTIAILCVLSVHFFLNTKFYGTPILGKSMYLQVFMRMMFLMCVPLFLLLTGYLQKNKQVTKSYFKKIIPILIIYFIYSAMFIAFRIIILKEHKSVIQWIASIEDFSAENYSWYIEMYIGLFLISPFLNLVYNNLNSKKQKDVLILISIFMTACPVLFNGKMYGLMNFPNYWSSIYPVTYYFIGCYIREYQPQIKKLYTLVVWFLAVLLGTFLEIYGAKKGNFSSYVGYYGSLIITVQAVAFFLAFYHAEIKNRIAVKVISTISVLSLDIYLASKTTDAIVYKELYKYYPLPQQKIVLLYLPTVFCTFTLAFIISLVRSKVIRLRRTVTISNSNNIKVSG